MEFKTVGTFTLAGTMLLAGATYYVVCGCTLLAPQPPPPPPSLCDPGGTFDPVHPEASGYQIVFEDHFPNMSTIDLNNTGNFGYHWYLRHPFGYQTTPGSDFSIDSNGLVLSATQSPAGFSMQTATNMANTTNGLSWVGTSFGPGYFESTFSLDSAFLYANGFSGGNPSYWSMDVAHIANVGGDQWPGQAGGYVHYIEDDFFEYDNINGNSNYWGSGQVDWSGQYNVTCPGFCRILNDGSAGSHGLNTIGLSSPSRAVTWNVTTFHTLGALWVKGDSNNSFNGYRQIYFDGGAAPAQVGANQVNNKTPWLHDTMPSPASLPNSPEVWSIQDNDLIEVNFGSGVYSPTPQPPFHIKSVRFWQIPGCGTAPVSGPPGFYMAPSTATPAGNDSNPGTRAAPFLTFNKCQIAMRTGNKTCYVKKGTYTATSWPSTPACGSGNCVLSLTSSDNNETWAYDPIDGVDTADIGGGSTISGNGLWAFADMGATNLTFDGLNIHNFDFAGFTSIGGVSGLTVRNNIISNINFIVASGPQNAAAVQCYHCANATIAHNYIHDIASFGISISGGSTSNLVYDSNVLQNTCTQIRDCGALYTQDTPTGASTGQIMVNNYVRDGVTFSGTAGGWGSSVYLDDCASNWTIKGNVLAGNNGTNNFMIHGGNHISVTGNILDLDGQNVSLARFQSSGCPAITGNTFQGNIIISNGSAGGYNGFTGNVTTQNNAYFNYDGGTLLSSGDSNPVVENPSLSCYSYLLSTGSLAKNSPVSFPDLYRGWGPPGFTINQTGTAPSSPHGC